MVNIPKPEVDLFVYTWKEVLICICITWMGYVPLACLPSVSFKGRGGFTVSSSASEESITIVSSSHSLVGIQG